MENLIEWLENKVHICIYLYRHINIFKYQSVPSPFPNRRIIESVLSSLTHFSSMSPALGYTGGLLTTRNVCSLKSHGTEGWQTSKQWRKEWVIDSSTEALSHLCQPSWLCSCCLLLNILSPTFHKKETWPSFVSVWTPHLKLHRPPDSATKFAERQGSCLPLSEHLIEHLLACTPVSPSAKMVRSVFFEWPLSMLVENMLYEMIVISIKSIMIIK